MCSECFECTNASDAAECAPDRTARSSQGDVYPWPRYCTELRALRRLQYVYERDSRVYWNRILYPEVLEETLYYCDTDHIICREIEFIVENKDLELAFYRASGPRVRYKLFTKRLITAI